jgi:exodeoxyribonuclease VII large subunit
MLKPYFETSTGRDLESGLKILVSVSVEFHEVYGFSLNIKDIDPAYTLGDIELARLQIIQRLTDEGVISMNKELELPDVIQKIAVISSDTAAGYQDFIKQLQNNAYGYKFYFRLFPAVMQGEKTEQSIIKALDLVYSFGDFFDAVVIIRGGGSRSDLLWFDNYNLAYYITQFPLPVISGIGHDKDVSIVDLVSHTSLKTPTAVAEFLISLMSDFDQKLDEVLESMIQYCRNFFETEYDKLDSLSGILVPVVQRRLHFEQRRIDLSGQKVSYLAKAIIEKRKHEFDFAQLEIKRLANALLKWKSKELDHLIVLLKNKLTTAFRDANRQLDYFKNSVPHFHPENVLRKGYSMTKLNRKILTNSNDVIEGQSVETILYNGSFKSKVSGKP